MRTDYRKLAIEVNQEKDNTPQFKLGDICIGQNIVYYQQGKITDIRMSTGSRHGYIYKIGINYFFYEEISLDPEGIMMDYISKENTMMFTKTMRFQFEGTSYKLLGLKTTEHFLYLVTDTKEINVRFLCKPTYDNVFRFFNERKDDASYTVWVGGGEVNENLVTYKSAREIADEWIAKGYDDVVIELVK